MDGDEIVPAIKDDKFKECNWEAGLQCNLLVLHAGALILNLLGFTKFHEVIALRVLASLNLNLSSTGA